MTPFAEDTAPDARASAFDGVQANMPDDSRASRAPPLSPGVTAVTIHALPTSIVHGARQRGCTGCAME
jgi:hypothetical protein